MRTGRIRAPRVPERTVQRDVCQLLRTLGADVYVLGTVRPRGDHPGTCQTPGLPDLLAFLPETPTTWRRLLCLELKASGGRLSPAQQAFRTCCADAGVAHVTGDLDTVIAWLEAHGYLKSSSPRQNI